MNIYDAFSKQPIAYEYSDCWQNHFVLLECKDLMSNITKSESGFKAILATFWESEKHIYIIERKWVQDEQDWAVLESRTQEKINRKQIKSTQYEVEIMENLLELSRHTPKSIIYH